MAYAATIRGGTAEIAQSVILACVEYHFQSDQTSQPVEWLTDNDSCVKDYENVSFSKSLGMAYRPSPWEVLRTMIWPSFFWKPSNETMYSIILRIRPIRSFTNCMNGCMTITNLHLTRAYDCFLQENLSGLREFETVRFCGAPPSGVSRTCKKKAEWVSFGYLVLWLKISTRRNFYIH